jgi:two-component system cell cycle sensor histidine kinase/response regulator CckA
MESSNTAVEEAVVDFASSPPDVTNVLVIDDNDDFRAMIKDLLAPFGFRVKTVGNPVKALEIFTREKNNVHLVLLDYYMPLLDGAKTLEWLRKLKPQVKVVLCSGADELRLRQLQSQCRIEAYIHKPFRVNDVVAVIRRAMGQGAVAA